MILKNDSAIDNINVIAKDTLIRSQNFQEFWFAFRKLILLKHSNRPEELFHFPFEVFGFLDNDPKFNLTDIDSINMIFTKFLIETNVTVPNTKNHYELINSLTKLENFPGYTASENSRRIELMEFTRKTNGWQFSRIYMDTEALKKSLHL